MKKYYIIVLSVLFLNLNLFGEEDDKVDKIYRLPKSILNSMVKPGMKIGFGYRDYEKNKVEIKLSAIIDKDGKIKFNRGYTINGKSTKLIDVFKKILAYEEHLTTPNYGGKNEWTEISSNFEYKKVWIYGKNFSALTSAEEFLIEYLKKQKKENKTNSE
jgi:hypothetical protein